MEDFGNVRLRVQGFGLGVSGKAVEVDYSAVGD